MIKRLKGANITLMKNILWKGFLLGFVIALLLYMAVLHPGVYMRFWYCITWSVIASIGVLKMDFVNRRQTLKPAYQFIMALTLIFVTIIETDWAAFVTMLEIGLYAIRWCIIQWAYTILFITSLYCEGLRWAWSSLRRPLPRG